jgi:hypothetical protein
MRWDELRLTEDAGGTATGTLPLLPRGAVTRTFDTPEFAGMTFHEVTCRSALNKVPDASRMPFRWTVNPYRGCSMACVFCFARKTHEYLDLDSGADFDSQVVVKTNVGDVLRRELRRPSWTGEHVAMGTNVDCYQRVEGRYRLMRDVIPALTEVANPFSILTKGALILRDLDLLVAAAEVTDVSAALSIGSVDRDIRHRVEPGAPPPARRLEVVRRLTDAGIPTGVLMAPVLPFSHRLRRAARGDGGGHRGQRRHPRLPDRAAPAAGRPRVVAGLAPPRAARPAPPVRPALRHPHLRPEGLPGPDHRDRPPAGRAARGRSRAGRPVALRPRARSPYAGRPAASASTGPAGPALTGWPT